MQLHQADVHGGILGLQKDTEICLMPYAIVFIGQLPFYINGQ